MLLAQKRFGNARLANEPASQAEYEAPFQRDAALSTARHCRMRRFGGSPTLSARGADIAERRRGECRQHRMVPNVRHHQLTAPAPL